MKRFLLIALVACGLMLSIAGVASAQWETRTGDTIVVSTDEVISGDLWCAGQKVMIDGTVNGDLLVLANDLVINGKVNGDITGLSGKVAILGQVDGDIRVKADSIKVSGLVTRNTAVWTTQLLIDKGASLGSLWATVAGTSLQWNKKSETILNGKINGKVELNAGVVRIGGVLTGESLINAQTIYVDNGADLKLLNYRTNEQIIISPQATIGEKNELPPVKATGGGGLYLIIWIWFLGMLFMGFFMIGFTPARVRLWISGIQPWGRALLRGFILVAGIPVIILFLVFTGLGIPMAVFLSLVYLIFMLFGQLPFFFYFGAAVIRFFKVERNFPPFFFLLVGGITTTFLVVLPYVGFLFYLLATIVGVGILTQIPMIRIQAPVQGEGEQS
jgi:cytoskeletal protein CcmA (bactofilin family)